MKPGTTDPHITVAMIQAAQLACFLHNHPGKKPTEVAWIPPEAQMVRKMIAAALKEGGYVRRD